jgi:hypothetical protein
MGKVFPIYGKIWKNIKCSKPPTSIIIYRGIIIDTKSHLIVI